MTKLEHLIAIQTRLERIERLMRKELGGFDVTDTQYMSITEASHYTRLSVATIRRGILDGDLTPVSGGGKAGERGTGGKLIFRKSDITEWLEG